MTSKVVSIGNSAGIIIPSALLSSLGLKRNDRVTILETSTGFEVKKENAPQTFSELLESHYGIPFSSALEQFKSEGDDVEIDWGEPVGEEI